MFGKGRPGGLAKIHSPGAGLSGNLLYEPA